MHINTVNGVPGTLKPCSAARGDGRDQTALDGDGAWAEV